MEKHVGHDEWICQAWDDEMEEVSLSVHRRSWTKRVVPWRRLSKACWIWQPENGFWQGVAESPGQRVLQVAKVAPVSHKMVKKGACMGRDRSRNRDEEASRSAELERDLGRG